MDSEFGDFSWLTNMQQKFESLLPDVDDVLSDERLKYVEDRFQTVGSNIQTQLYAISTNFTQFCSEFAHDVLSPSSSILNEACRENSDIVLGKGKKSSKNEKPLLPDLIGLVDNILTDSKVTDENVNQAKSGKDSSLKSSLSDTIDVSRKCDDCQDKEETTVSVYGAADELSMQDDLLKSRTDSYMENIGLAKEVTIWDNYFTSDCAECSFDMDGEATGNRIIFNCDDDLNSPSELNFSGSCVLLEEDDSVVVCNRTAKQGTFKEKSRGDKPNDDTFFTVVKNRDRSPSTDSDWEII